MAGCQRSFKFSATAAPADFFVILLQCFSLAEFNAHLIAGGSGERFVVIRRIETIIRRKIIRFLIFMLFVFP